jgi:hypothetical protein
MSQKHEDACEKAWDLFRNIAGLANEAEEYAAKAEREACCCLGLNREIDKDAYREWDAASVATYKHGDAAKRHMNAARRQRRQLQALAESSGEENVAAHLRNSDFHIARAEKAEACARKAVELVLAMVADKPIGHFACQMTNL